MDYQEYYRLLEKNKFINPIWYEVCSLFEANASSDVVKLLLIYFSFIDDGNACMPLNEDKLLLKWKSKCEEKKILLSEKSDFDEEEINMVFKDSLVFVPQAILKIKEDFHLLGLNDLFVISEDYLFTRKFYNAKKSIEDSIKRLFDEEDNNCIYSSYRNWVNDNFYLSKGQEKAVVDGVKKNLIITGGPGTGKTTSILFLLINLLLQNSSLNIILCAPSGKASSRMKESILGGMSRLKSDFKANNQDIITKIEKSSESTIHRLLEFNPRNNDFNYNKNHMFNKGNIFIIDEASMIDINMFAKLLEAIPESSRIFIMGDKNQLPSVDCGAVFSDLLKKESLKENIVELDESIRFSKDTKIYELARCVNNGLEFPVSLSQWQSYQNFKIEEDDFKNKPIYYYLDNDDNEEKIFSTIIKKWSMHFYRELQAKSTNLNPNDYQYIVSLEKEIEVSKILTAENEGLRGNKNINKLVIKEVINQNNGLDNIFVGMILMVCKNNHSLDLYNGDTGISVSFEGDETMYFMVKKTSSLYTKDGKKDNSVFKLGEYLFYPIRLFASDTIIPAYSITIHKSQGSDYKNILVILPKRKGHPLLTREIVYTAITRTKGNTYIISNQERLNEGKDKMIVRETNIK